MRIALSTHLFAFHDLDDYIASLFPQFGFPVAELWAMPPHFPYRDGEQAARIAATLARHGVSVGALHAPLYPDVRTYRKDRWYSLCSGDEAHRRESVEATAAAGRWLAGRGGGTVVVHTSFPAQDWYPGRWAAFLSSLNELCDMVPSNVRFAVENTPSSSGRTEVILDIALRYPPERVGVCLDLGHAHIEEEIGAAVQAAAPRLLHVHAHDNRGDRDDHLVLGRGTIPWKTVAAALGAAGFEGLFSVELRDSTGDEGAAHDSFEAMLGECRDALRRFFQ